MAKYTKEMFKRDLSHFCNNAYDPVKVAKAASLLLFKHRADIDLELEEKILDIMTMEDGSEFEMTEEEFKKFLNEI